MSNLVFPSPSALPGITYDSVRAPDFDTGVQTATTGKESRIAYRPYCLMTWELTYELLRDNIVPSELKALFGLFMQLAGRWDTCLYSDPVFNSVTAMPFAVIGSGDTAGPSGTRYQITAIYQNTGGPGAAELIQNFNGTPQIFDNGTLISGANYTLDGTGGIVFGTGHLPTVGHTLTWTGAFYYRVRFDDDSLEFSQFMNNLWEVARVKLRQVKL